ncbi:hypothetical protein [Bosea sp. OAE506]|uniref:hypothetical protein n=1 Tax=Bosea sp. OAE506 TaxID=2663870 RepID=UPI0033966D74
MSAGPAVTPATRGPLAIIAGAGDFPPRLAALAAQQGRSVFVAALDGAAESRCFRRSRTPGL